MISMFLIWFGRYITSKMKAVRLDLNTMINSGIVINKAIIIKFDYNLQDNLFNRINNIFAG